MYDTVQATGIPCTYKEVHIIPTSTASHTVCNSLTSGKSIIEQNLGVLDDINI